MTDAKTQSEAVKKEREGAKELLNTQRLDLQNAPIEAKKAAVEAHEAVTAALEVGGETVSEITREQQETAGEQRGAGASRANAADTKTFIIPESQEVLVKEIDKELSRQLKKLKKEESRAQGGIFRKMNPEKLSNVVAQMRRIQRLLAELIYMTVEALKNLYKTLFQPKGL